MIRIIKVYNVWNGSSSSHEFNAVESALRFLADMGFEPAPDTPMTVMDGDDNDEECVAYWYTEPGVELDSYGDGYEPVLVLDCQTSKELGI